MSEKIKKEYGEVFEGEEQATHQALSIKTNLEVKLREILIEDIIISDFKKGSRGDTLIGLSGLVEEWGVVTPIHVLALEDEGCYMLLDGLRRVFSAVRSKMETIPAMVWDFEDKEEGKEKANVISLLLNRSQKHNAGEQWEQMKVLESVNEASPSLVEYLLQMESGDAMKLKDVMLASAEYNEIKEKLMLGELSIDGAYKKLASARKKEDKLAREESAVIEEGAEGLGITSGLVNDEVDKEPALSVSEVKELLEMGVDGTEEGAEPSLEELDRTEEIRGNVVQDTKNRKQIDPSIKKSTLIRDNFTCRCCGLNGKDNNGWLDVLVYHHLIPVYCGGPDTVENGLTLCSNCHLVLHNYLFGKVHINIEELGDREKEIFKNIFKYGNIALDAQKRAGIGRKEADKLDAPSRKHKYPGEDLALKQEALKEAGE